MTLSLCLGIIYKRLCAIILPFIAYHLHPIPSEGLTSVELYK